MKSAFYSTVYKTLGLFLFLSLGCLSLFCGAASAESATITGNIVNVRSGPGSAYDIVGMLAKDTSISVLERSNGWCKMQAGNVSGWIDESLIESSPEITLRVKATTANLRSGAGTSFDKLGEAKLGDSLKLLDVHGEWYQIRTSLGKVGYINASLVEGNTKIASSSTTVQSGPSTATNVSVSRSPSNEIKVYVNGGLQTFDVNPIIANGRTLVPLRAIFEAMGASISWDGDSQTVNAQKGGTSVVLTIGSLSSTVNGQTVQLDVPAKIIRDRTLAPLRFVGEALGGRVAWDEAAREVKIFSPTNPGDKLKAVIIDRDEVNLRSAPTTAASMEGTATSGQQYEVFSEKDGWYKITDNGKAVWVAGWLVKPVWTAGTSGTSSTSNSSSSSTPVATSSGPEINIQFNKDADGYRLLMESTSKLKIDIDEAAGSIDYVFSDSKVSQDTNIQEQLGDSVLSINAYNQGGDVKVHVSLPQSLKYEKSSENNGKKQVLFIPNCIVSLERQTFNGSGERIIISTALGSTFTQQQNGNTMTLTLPGVGKGLAQESYSFSSDSLKSLKIDQNAYTATVKITTKEEAKFSIGSGSDGKSIHILFINKSDIPPRNSLVVLDAGHGGRDCGASGESLAESDINLELAQKVGALLAKKGIKVDYTRGDDGYVSLADRAATANLLNAALFVSIHNNANADSSKMGTETYYYAPLDNADLYLQKDDREKLATAIQTRLISNLGRLDRGVKTANFQVLRDTEMPSALAECVFISNPEEENLLQQENFKNSIARAIADGIAACMSGTTTLNPKL